MSSVSFFPFAKIEVAILIVAVGKRPDEQSLYLSSTEDNITNSRRIFEKQCSAASPHQSFVRQPQNAERIIPQLHHSESFVSELMFYHR